MRWYGGTSSTPRIVSRHQAVIRRSLIDPIIAGAGYCDRVTMDSSNFLPRHLTPRHIASSAAKLVRAPAGCWHGVDRGLMGAGDTGPGGKTWGHGELWRHAIMQWVSCPTNMIYLYLYLFILSTNWELLLLSVFCFISGLCPGLSVA